MRFHPACAIFPLLEGDEFGKLVEDIRAHGQREKILVDEGGAILDGRNRYRACRELGIEPRVATWRPREGDSVIALVVSLNIVRRHLDATAKAVLSDKLEPMISAEIKKQQQEALAKRERDERGRLKPLTEKVQYVESRNEGMASAKAAKLTGANSHYVADVKAFKRDAPELYTRIERGELKIPEAKAALKAEKKAQVAEQIRSEPKPFPDGPFRVFVADPPWQYASRVDDATHRARNPYPDMTVEAICGLRDYVVPRATDDAVLWLWTTNAFMRDAFTVLDAWGFEHKTILTWVKDQMGTGDWLRGQTEHCLMAIKGRPVVTLTNQTTVLAAPRSKHSAKPDEFYALVESLCPGSKLEMFARKKRDGWESWGAEAPDK